MNKTEVLLLSAYIFWHLNHYVISLFSCKMFWLKKEVFEDVFGYVMVLFLAFDQSRFYFMMVTL